MDLIWIKTKTMSSPDSEYAKKGKGYYLCKTSNIKNTPLASASMVIFTIV